MEIADKLLLLPVMVPALIAAMALHELAHGIVADRLGDPTARSQGRLTLNPIAHIDPVGSVSFVVTFLLFPFAFGWAKPVIVQPGNFRHPQRGMALVAIAGPLTNFLLAYLTIVTFSIFSPPESEYLRQVIFIFTYLNIILGVFNLFPLPPLDGSRIVGAFMNRETWEKWASLDQWGGFILIALLIFAGEPLFQLIGAGYDAVLDVIQALPGVEWVPRIR